MGDEETNNTKRIAIFATSIFDQFNEQVYKDSKKYKSFVVPGVVNVKVDRSKENYVEFTALETDAKLLFPDLDLLDPDSRPDGDFITIPEGESKTIKISSTVDNGVYPYVVITTVNKDLATGGSFPKFIVDIM